MIMQQFFSFLGLFWKKVLAVSAVEVGVRSGKEEGVSLRLGLPHSEECYQGIKSFIARTA